MRLNMARDLRARRLKEREYPVLGFVGVSTLLFPGLCLFSPKRLRYAGDRDRDRDLLMVERRDCLACRRVGERERERE